MKKIGIIVRGITHGGVMTYIYSILENFDKQNDDYEIYVIHNLRDLDYRYKFLKSIYFNIKDKIIFDYIFSLYAIVKYKLDIVLYPKGVIPLIHHLVRTKKINIIHDLGYFEKKLKAYKFWDTIFMRIFMKISCILSNTVITVSESTKSRIIKKFRIKENKIKVIYEGVRDCFKKIDDEKINNQVFIKYKINKPFIFYSGSISPRKNLMRALIAFNEIKNNVPHNFYITGMKYWGSGRIQNYIEKNLSKRVFILGYIENQELVTMYNKAELFLYPSLYEGFGLPIIEAQACGCPVLTSDRTSCPEVAGNAACIVDPYSVEEIKNGILKTLNNSNYKKQLIQKGFKNVKRFSWIKTTNEILKIINGD